jgi:uncharacterized membrane protein SpoIIM required for sporulation
MKKICLIFTISLFGWLGWKLGAPLGIMGAYLLSFAGSLVGVFVGYFINQRYLG